MYVVTRECARRSSMGLALALALAACTPASKNMSLVEGPAAEDIVTPFEDALMCLNGKVDSRLSFGVGGIPDQTGREANAAEGAGRYVTQGAGDIVQSALFKAGVTVINRRDMGSAVMESQWGIRSLETQQQAHLVITGSINSLDFLPGGGAIGSARGVGPRYRQHRILVGFDLALTNNNTGQILANISLHKQMFAEELGFGGTRFVSGNLLDADVGFARREAVNYALRKMLQLATFELLVQMMPPERYVECAEKIDPRYGQISGGRTSGEQLRRLQARLAAEQERAAAAAAAMSTSSEETEEAATEEGATEEGGADTTGESASVAPGTAAPEGAAPDGAAQPLQAGTGQPAAQPDDGAPVAAEAPTQAPAEAEDAPNMLTDTPVDPAPVPTGVEHARATPPAGPQRGLSDPRAGSEEMRPATCEAHPAQGGARGEACGTGTGTTRTQLETAYVR